MASTQKSPQRNSKSNESIQENADIHHIAEDSDTADSSRQLDESRYADYVWWRGCELARNAIASLTPEEERTKTWQECWDGITDEEKSAMSEVVLQVARDLLDLYSEAADKNKQDFIRHYMGELMLEYQPSNME